MNSYRSRHGEEERAVRAEEQAGGCGAGRAGTGRARPRATQLRRSPRQGL